MLRYPRFLKRSSNKQGIVFFTTTKTLRKGKRVDVDFNQSPLEDVLQTCFRDQPLSYDIVDKTIVIKEKEESPLTVVSADAEAKADIKGKITDENNSACYWCNSLRKKEPPIPTATNDEGEFTLTTSSA